MLQPWQDAVVTKIVQETPTTKRFFMALTSGQVFDFTPGQFVTLDLPIHEQKNKRWRSYSIASVEYGQNVKKIELCISLNEKGRVTPWLFSLKAGALIDVSVPQGGFVLRSSSMQENVIFVCTGTGVAPFRSMIAASLALNPNRHVHLVFGNRKVEDVLYHDHWLALREQNSNFHYHPVLSKGDEGLSALTNSNNFQKGYVHPIYEQLLSKDLGSHVYVCGREVMCTESRERLKAMGLTRRQYFFEQYDG
jgi:CDP-4-dehydro-6-deoxyglucose reductase